MHARTKLPFDIVGTASAKHKKHHVIPMTKPLNLHVCCCFTFISYEMNRVMVLVNVNKATKTNNLLAGNLCCAYVYCKHC